MGDVRTKRVGTEAPKVGRVDEPRERLGGKLHESWRCNLDKVRIQLAALLCVVFGELEEWRWCRSWRQL